MRTPILLICLLSTAFLTCHHKMDETAIVPAPPPGPAPGTPLSEQIDILALGDSYTKGESVVWSKNFPNQLTDSLKAEGHTIIGTRIIAQTGWRSNQLISAIASQKSIIGDSTFSIVTLCIGVNNQYQGADFDIYKKELDLLLQTAITRTGGRKSRVFVLSIPDWAYTTYGQNFANTPDEVSQEIDQYNAAKKTLCETYGVHYVNVTDISRLGLAQPSLVASDGLHPSVAQYTEWLKRLLPVVRASLKE